MIMRYINTKQYNKLVQEIDVILDSKKISYAYFSKILGINPITFYNRFKSYGFTVEDLIQFLAIAQKQEEKKIACLKCGRLFMPKAKSVKRAFCEECKEEMRKKSTERDGLRFKYPEWVASIKNKPLRYLVEQEFHIDEETAREMSGAKTTDEAKRIRSLRWHQGLAGHSSILLEHTGSAIM